MTRLLPLLLILAACGPAETDPEDDASAEAPVSESALEGGTFGTTVPDGDMLTPDELIAGADEFAGKSVTVEGTVRNVCSNAGCWLTLADGQGRTIRVEVPRDESDTYVYTFPTDVSGATVRLIGLLEVETESVEDQRHYLEDGGASAEEIEAVTEPRQTLVLTALGAEIDRADLEDADLEA